MWDKEHAERLDAMIANRAKYALVHPKGMECLIAARDRISELERSGESWEQTAAQHCRNEQYYRGLVVQIGKTLGDSAYVSDDGSIQQDVLCAKVPELVRELEQRVAALVECVNFAESFVPTSGTGAGTQRAMRNRRAWIKRKKKAGLA